MKINLLCHLFQRHLYRTVEKIPDKLKNVMDQETYEKARLYNLDKSNFGFWVGLIGEIENSVVHECVYLNLKI